MIPQKSLVYLFVITLLSISSCKKSDSPPSLPPATQEGKNTFGCLIDGKVYTPKTRFNSHLYLQATYLTISPATFNISAPRVEEANGELVFFRSSGLILSEGQTYKLGDDGANGVIFAHYRKSINFNATGYDSRNGLPGEITITRLTPKIISGTFSFDAVSSDGKKVEVREGRFDLPNN